MVLTPVVSAALVVVATLAVSVTAVADTSAAMDGLRGLVLLVLNDLRAERPALLTEARLLFEARSAIRLLWK